jgi:hypothetical protein
LTAPEKSVDSAIGRVYFSPLLSRTLLFRQSLLKEFGSGYSFRRNLLSLHERTSGYELDVSEGFFVSAFLSFTPVSSETDSFDRAEKSGRV